MSAQDTFFALEPALMARLEAQFGGMTPKVHVLTATDLAGVLENQQFTPAVHVIYNGYRPVTNNYDGSACKLEQDWLCIVATRSQKDIRAGKPARSLAGVLARHVCAALMGYVPAPGLKPLKLASPPGAGYSGGFQYLPLAFTAEFTFHPTKDQP